MPPELLVIPVAGFPLLFAESLGGPRLAVDQQGVLHLRLLPPAGYLVVLMTNGGFPGGQPALRYFLARAA
jgi:hypothetical protein